MEPLPAMRSHPLVPLLLLLVLSAPGAPANSPPDSARSPVFRSTRPATLGPLYHETDITRELWNSFVVVREANAGDPAAQHQLGLRYLLGRGFSPDTMLAALWVARAAEQNLTAAQFNMGIFLLNGWGVQWDPFEAYRQFETAAAKGMPEAHYALGALLVENLVVPRDLDAAAGHFRTAADSGLAAAREMVERIERFAAEEASRRGEKRDSTSPDVRAMMAVAETDPGTPPDSIPLRTAVRTASPELRSSLGLPARPGDLLSESEDSIRAAVRRAADAGSPEALILLGRQEEEGRRGPPNPLAAGVHYARATRLGSPQAAQLLAALLERGPLVDELKKRSGEPAAKYLWASSLALGFGGALFRHQAYLTEGQAVEQLETSAGTGYIPALIELGIWRFSGRWMRSDRTAALRAWEEAARLGSREAEVRLAMIVVAGREKGLELKEALGVLQTASAEGALLADVGLAYCYEEGRGVPVNLPAALRLYRSSAQRGSEDAYRALRRLHDRRRPAEKRYAITSE